MKRIILLTVPFTFFMLSLRAQTAEEIIALVKQKSDKVNDYEAKGKLKTNVVFIKAPVATVKVYFKKPDKLRIKNEKGISFIPKGSVNVNLGNIFAGNASYDIIDGGKEPGTDSVSSNFCTGRKCGGGIINVVYRRKTVADKKAKTTTKENGTFELEMTYGKYAEYGLADKVIFSFNTKDYKLPKGVTFDYDDGTKKEDKNKLKNKKGKIE